jgi:hypothetical protein
MRVACVDGSIRVVCVEGSVFTVAWVEGPVFVVSCVRGSCLMVFCGDNSLFNGFCSVAFWLSGSLHSYPHRFMTRISRLMILTSGWPSPQPSSSAGRLRSSPMWTALFLLLRLTTACARLSLLDIGCSGMVYFNNVTANARTKGARLVKTAADFNTLSSSSASGSARDVSNSAASNGCPYDALTFFGAGAGVAVGADASSLAPRFLETRFAALRTCRASFSSPNTTFNRSKSAFARSDALAALASVSAVTAIRAHVRT